MQGIGRGNAPRTPNYYELDPELRIDDAATQKKWGYSATSVATSSTKKVECQCSRCHQIFSRSRSRVVAPVLCHSCVKTKHVREDPTLLVDAEETERRFGYAVNSLRRSSNEKVIGICSRCNTRYPVRMKSVKVGMMCRPCLRTSACEEQWAPREDDGKKNLNDAETQKQLGYLASTISSKAATMVVANCPCGNVYQRIRRNISDDSTCVSCGRKKIDHTELQEKRIKTLVSRYPEGLPLFSSNTATGAAAQIAIFLEKGLGRKLTREKALPSGKRIDIFDLETQVGVEYCGLYWHNEDSPSPRGKWFHWNKMTEAQNAGYRLITVFEDEYLTAQSKVEQRLSEILKRENGTQIIGARECVVTPAKETEVQQFLFQYHLQNASPNLLVAYGLRHNKQLIGVIVGGKHHRQKHETELVLSRLCFSPGVRVSGGTEKMFKQLCSWAQEHGYTKISTWSDNRWSDGAVYSRLGMKLVKVLPPDYSYVETASPRKRFSKQSQKKSKTNCPKGMTEKEWTAARGLSRIWDCGKKRWEKIL